MVKFGICKRCGYEHFCKSSMTLKKYCPVCRKSLKESRSKNSKNIETKRKINKKCELCGWNKAYLDIHHIKPISMEGNNDMNNLLAVCPNCHRMLHCLKINLQS